MILRYPLSIEELSMLEFFAKADLYRLVFEHETAKFAIVQKLAACGYVTRAAGHKSKTSRFYKSSRFYITDAGRARLEAPKTPNIVEALGFSTPWPVTDVLSRLAEATEHLLRDHDCDLKGWEGVSEAANAARRIVDELKASMAWPMVTRGKR